MTRIVPVWIGLAALVALPGAESASTEDAKLTAYFKAHLEREFQERPLEATRLGDHRFDAELDDVSARARARWIERYRTVLAGLRKAVDYAKLSRDAQIDLEIFEHDLKYRLWEAENTRPFEDDPRTYNGYLTDSVYLLFTQSTLDRARNVRNAAARIDRLGQILTAARASLKTPARALTETAIRQNRGAISFYENGIYELSGENPTTSALKGPCTRAVAMLREYQEFLEKTLLPRSTGEWRLGYERFASKMPMELNAGKTANEVLAEAEREFDRVRSEMYVIARQLWHRIHKGHALPPDDAAGRHETITRVLEVLNREHGKAEELISEAKTWSEKLKRFIAERDILRLPEPDRCKIVEMPEFQRGYSVAYLNPAPPLDPKASSYYAISPPPEGWDARRKQSFLEEYNRYLMQMLTIHEAYPGHYVQLEYSNRHPSFIRRVLQSGVFAEGWAVYTEQMMLDQGYGDGDLALRLNQLKWYLRAVANAILDHKMHCKNMSDEAAMELLVKQAFQSEGEAVGKILRAKQQSCQLSTYFVGRMAFYHLRQAVQREQGAAFQLGRFHEAVLSHGTLPVRYLPELVRVRLRSPR
ncbi:MAG: DUF885 domain-containing protein [Gemmataceae bacterium]